MTAAAWMDRLSDRLGSLIPGSSRWPPRHPVKVSLLMGGLATLSGGLSSVIGAAIEVSRFGDHPDRLALMFMAAGVVFSFFVVIPWAVWLGATRRQCFFLAPYCWIGNFCGFMLFDADEVGLDISLGLFGLATGLYLALLAEFLVQRPIFAWAMATTFLSGVGGVVSTIAAIPDWLPSFIPEFLRACIQLYEVLTLLFASPALCLGYLLWDAPHRP